MGYERVSEEIEVNVKTPPPSWEGRTLVEGTPLRVAKVRGGYLNVYFGSNAAALKHEALGPLRDLAWRVYNWEFDQQYSLPGVVAGDIIIGSGGFRLQEPAVQDPALQEDEATPVSGVTSGAKAPTEERVTVQYVHTSTVHGTPTYYLKSSDGMRWQVEEYAHDGKIVFAVSTWTEFGWEIVIHNEITQRINSSVEDSVRIARVVLVA